jgi:uncharacterized protein (TIGR02757 family)
MKPSGKGKTSLKSLLDHLYHSQATQDVQRDPLGMVMRYKEPRDREIAGFFAAMLALGRVDLICRAVKDLLVRMNPSPYRFVRGFRPDRDAAALKGFRYRFYGPDDVGLLIYWLHQALARWGSLENLFSLDYRPGDPNIGSALSSFVRTILSQDRGRFSPELPPRGRGMRHFLADPRDGSGCKRLNLFLRWMVRRDSPDLGLWRGIDPSRLIIPLDTHVARLSVCLGFTRRRQADWKMAEEITASLRDMDPCDPVKYDFALCHLGMTFSCPPKPGPEACSECVIFSFCRRVAHRED